MVIRGGMVGDFFFNCWASSEVSNLVGGLGWPDNLHFKPVPRCPGDAGSAVSDSAF